MLKRLELLGFKSFADKTAFDFGSGITCIVGPNGSGKSNVVDAIKWVLGEQSAKSLRGKEMADVIFNGSATRRSLGFAEATLVFDNARRLLPVEANEVQLTRRVYRSGEGEYLINKNAARLRDFRDLFMGTGAGTEAYSVIEQGKVDVLLQSSTKDRRVIFEEAAGISKFKSRKLEALRKLEHVDQNLLRMHDIVEEVEKQLRSVKLAAAKARRHKEYSERLRELRLKTGLADFHNFTVQLDEYESKATGLGDQAAAQATRCDAVDAKLIQVQSLTEEIDNQNRSLESSLADCRQEIARLESQIAYERAHARDLTGQIERLRGQWSEFSSRVFELERHIATIGGEVTRVEEQCNTRRADVETEAAAVEQLRSEIEADQEKVNDAESRLMDCVQADNQLDNELAALNSQEKTLQAQQERLLRRCQSLAGPMSELTAQVKSFSQQESSTNQDRDATHQQLSQIEQRMDDLQAAQRSCAAKLAAMREDRSAIAARVELLDDLEQRKEGIGSGVQEVLNLPEFTGKSVGLVADLLQVDVAHASSIELALGERAQHIVVRRQADVVLLLSKLPKRLQGTVSLIALDCLNALPRRSSLTANSTSQNNPSDHPDFIAMAAALVRPVAGCETLCNHLLDRTAVVRDIGSALAIANNTGGDLRFVTSDGDILESDGTITTGDPHGSVGLVSRKSQLRALLEQSKALDGRIAALDQELGECAQNLRRQEHERTILENHLTAAVDQAARIANQLSQRRQQLASLEEELALQRSEIATIDRDLTEAATRRAELQARLRELDEEQSGIEQFIQDQQLQIETRLAGVEDRQAELTAGRIELAKIEGQLAGLRQRLTALTTDLDERRHVQRETSEQIDTAVDREIGCQRKILAASSQIAGLYLQKEKVSREIATLAERRDLFRSQRQSLSLESHSSREQLQRLQAELHQQQLGASEIKHQRTTLVERIREDYELDLAALFKEYQPDPLLDRDAIQQEMQELRRKITSLGNVNLEALSELQELETRAATLHAQITDLTQSKATLDEIIRKINQDSQRLFMETLESIRSHFGELFRKLFGGGRADILLENETDVLESGIEIVARPPGKELRALSLLSGGEKTLTTVALLLAVFRSKPSPFCILDEVDAALDEPNIERYTTLLREFSNQAQFIMITHSKKSMICADVLYGITMQESGVSKRFSVCFEDVNEQGEINHSALQRETAAEPAEPIAKSDQEAA